MRRVQYGILRYIGAIVDLIVESITGEPLLLLGFLLVIGHGISVLVKRIGLPEISGYIIAGLLFGESILGIITHESSVTFATVSELALGLIALTIGGEFLWSKVRSLGSRMIIITAVQVLLTFGCVFVGLSIANLSPAIALLLGAISAATAPAATVAIVQSLNLKGKFVDYLYGIVALDDAATVILFGLVSALVVPLGGDFGHGMSIFEISHAFGELFFSLLLGVGGGAALHIMCSRIRISGMLTILGGGGAMLIGGLAHLLHLSPLLSTMLAGATLINFSRRNERIFRALQPFAPLVYALFFIVAGSELRPEILIQPQVLILGGIYIGARAIGKYGGVYLGALVTRAPVPIRQWMGVCMLPQAGVALGLIIVIQSSLAPTVPLVADNLQLITNIVLFSVFINELIGPPLSRLAAVRGSRGEV